MVAHTELLRVENLRTHFFVRRGVVKAVDGVSFSLNRGETLGIVGESACGKSVTALSLLRLVPEPAGRIVGGKVIFEGKNLLEMPESEMRRIRGKKIAMILQDPMSSLNPAYTVGDQIAEVLRLHQKLRGKTLWDRVVQALRLVQIGAPEARVQDYPHQMSGGMRQRILGAIALSCEPSLLIADEPTTSLDVTTQAQYLALIKELQQQTGVALIFITHDFGIVARMCNRVAVMYAGRIVEAAETKELLNHPCHPYTKALISCLPRMDAEWQRLANIEGQPPDLSGLSSGCYFSPRCTAKTDACQADYPPEVAIDTNHYVACWAAKA